MEGYTYARGMGRYNTASNLAAHWNTSKHIRFLSIIGISALLKFF